MIFQDPMTCLNPALRSPPSSSSLWKSTKELGKQALHRAIEALEEVRIPEADKGFFLSLHFREACASGS